ncbi:MAG: hypothetical protein MUF38_11105 [Anaerolineae bacterium]|jgi:tetratricopeptide (TPR) repeat protein|nr:hypothetical protein [Anaerolineae bacterium]
MFFQNKQQKSAEKLKQAVAQLQAGQIKDGIKLLEEAGKLDPMNAQIFGLMGRAYQMEDNNKAAILNFQKAVALNRSDHESMGRMAACQLELAQFNEAEVAMNYVINLFQKQNEPLPEQYRAVAQAVSIMKARHEAETEFKRSPRKNAALDSVPAAKSGLEAVKEKAKHDPAGAMNQFDALLKAHNNIAELYYSYAASAGTLGVLDRAMYAYTIAILLDPRFTDAYLNRASIWNTIGRFHDIIADMDTVLAYEPNNLDAYVGRGMGYQLKGDMASAMRDYEKLLKADLRTHPNAGLLLKKADLMFAQKDLIGALEAYDTLLARSDINPALAANAHYGRTKILLNMGRTQDAVGSAKQAVSLVPSNPDYCHMLGEAAKQAGMWTDSAAGWRAYVAAVKAGGKGFLPLHVAEHFLSEAEERV